MRKILITLSLILVIAAFAIFTVFVLLYAQGKTFDGTSGIVQTGIIRVNSNPKDVNVYVNEEQRTLVESKIDALEPGKVNLTLRLDGYYDWTKDITVEAGVLKDVFVQMIPKTIELSDVTTDDITLFIPSNINDYIYYVSLESDRHILKKIKVRRDFLDFSNSNPTTIRILEASEYELLVNSEILLVSRDNVSLLFANNPLNTTGIISLSNGEIELLTDLPTKVNKEITWFRNSGSILVTSDAGLTYEYNLNTGLAIIVANSPAGIYKASDYVVFKTAEKVLLYQNERITPLLVNSTLITQVLASINLHPTATSTDIFALQDSTKRITLIDLNKNLTISSNLVGDIIHSSSDATHFIIKNDSGIHSVSFEYSIATKTYKLAESTLSNETLNISDVLEYTFYNSNKNILYSTISQIYTSDLDGANFREITIPQGYEVLEASITNDNQFIYTVLREVETDLIKIYKISIVLK